MMNLKLATDHSSQPNPHTGTRRRTLARLIGYESPIDRTVAGEDVPKMLSSSLLSALAMLVEEAHIESLLSSSSTGRLASILNTAKVNIAQLLSRGSNHPRIMTDFQAIFNRLDD